MTNCREYVLRKYESVRTPLICQYIMEYTDTYRTQQKNVKVMLKADYIVPIKGSIDIIGADGYPVALCTRVADVRPIVLLLDPATGGQLASLEVAAGSLFGGVYGYLDHEDRMVLVDGADETLQADGQESQRGVGHGSAAQCIDQTAASER